MMLIPFSLESSSAKEQSPLCRKLEQSILGMAKVRHASDIMLLPGAKIWVIPNDDYLLAKGYGHTRFY